MHRFIHIEKSGKQAGRCFTCKNYSLCWNILYVDICMIWVIDMMWLMYEQYVDWRQAMLYVRKMCCSDVINSSADSIHAHISLDHPYLNVLGRLARAWISCTHTAVPTYESLGEGKYCNPVLRNIWQCFVHLPSEGSRKAFTGRDIWWELEQCFSFI